MRDWTPAGLAVCQPKERQKALVLLVFFGFHVDVSENVDVREVDSEPAEQRGHPAETKRQIGAIGTEILPSGLSWTENSRRRLTLGGRGRSGWSFHRWRPGSCSQPICSCWSAGRGSAESDLQENTRKQVCFHFNRISSVLLWFLVLKGLKKHLNGSVTRSEMLNRTGSVWMWVHKFGGINFKIWPPSSNSHQTSMVPFPCFFLNIWLLSSRRWSVRLRGLLVSVAAE